MDLFKQSLLFKIANALDEVQEESSYSPVTEYYKDPFEAEFEPLSTEEKEDYVDKLNEKRWGNKSKEELIELLRRGYMREIRMLFFAPPELVEQNPEIQARKQKIEENIDELVQYEKPQVAFPWDGKHVKVLVNGEEIAKGKDLRQALLRAVAELWT